MKNNEENKDKYQDARKKVDKIIDAVGSGMLQRIGVPKPVADKAIKNNGGILSPSNSPIVKNVSRNVIAKGVNTINPANQKKEKLEEKDQIKNNKINNNQPDLENPASPDIKKKKEEKSKDEEIKDKIKKVILRKIGLFLISNPIALISIIIGLFLIILIAMDFDFGGRNSNSEEYSTNCTTINLAWENPEYVNEHQNAGDYAPITDLATVDLSNTERFSYEEYSLEDYVKGIIWTDNDKAGDIKNETVYQLMAIATRSRIIATIPNNCVVARDANPENFTKLNGTESKYQEISKAVDETSGLLIGKNQTILNAKYDVFSYTKKSSGESASYYMMNEDFEGPQIIPVSWVEEQNIPITKVLTSSKYESMSLYGAKYLLEKVDSPYDRERTLRYYYGNEIEYYKIENQMGMNTAGCMWWPIGSDATTVENGVTFAKGNPATTRITSNFGYRSQPIAGATTNHKAIDIGGGVEAVTNIIAVSDGTVIATNNGCVKGASGCGGGLGNYVKIQHSNGTITRYGHMFSVSVSNGDIVKQGQVIGKMGTTGTSTGVHLDFQVIVNGTPVNPLNYVSVGNPRNQCSFSGSITPGNNVSQTICLTLKNNGFSDNAIAGILGNVEAESSFNPSSVNSRGCSGIVQWCYGRNTLLRSIYGANWSVLENQLEYMFSELNGSEKKVMPYLHGSYNAAEMAYHFCNVYERPEKGICESGLRQGYANAWLSYVTNGCK